MIPHSEFLAEQVAIWRRHHDALPQHSQFDEFRARLQGWIDHDEARHQRALADGK